MAGDCSFNATASLSLFFKVPFGSLAFMPGQLVHTNEILVLLGDNYFVERSAFQAVEIVSRRLKGELSVPSCSTLKGELSVPSCSTLKGILFHIER